MKQAFSYPQPDCHIGITLGLPQPTNRFCRCASACRVRLVMFVLALLSLSAPHADPLACWEPRLLQGRDLYGINRVEDLWVATGWDSIVTSTDATSWQDCHTPDPNQLLRFTSTASGNGVFVAIGARISTDGSASGTASLALSSDGITWLPTESGQYVDVYDLAFGNGTFVGVGGDDLGGVILTSSDGFSWNYISTGASGGLGRIIFAADNFVAVGGQGLIMTSPDGLVWSNPDSGTIRDLRAIAYGNGLYIAGGDQGLMLRSTDAITWTTGNTGETGSSIQALTFGAGQFVAAPNFAGYLFSSTDGITWRRHNEVSPFGAQRLVYGDGKILAVDFNTRVWQSQSLLNGAPPEIVLQPASQSVPFNADAVLSVVVLNCSPPQFQWLRNGIPIPGETRDRLVLRNVTPALAGNYSVTVSDTFASLTSQVAHLDVRRPSAVDFWQWRHPFPQGNSLRSVVHTPGRFITVGDFGAILESEDGVQWTLHSLETPTKLNSVAYGAGRFTAVGRADMPPPVFSRPALITSLNGIDWTELQNALPPTAYPSMIVFGNGRFVLNGGFSSDGSYHFFSSTDGLSWSEQGMPTGVTINDLIFANGQFVMVGTNPLNDAVILTSTDGLSWKMALDIQKGMLALAAYGNGLYIGVGGQPRPAVSNGFSLTSPDAVNWTVYNSNTLLPQDLLRSSLAFGNGEFVLMGHAVASNDPLVIFTSRDGEAWSLQEVPNIRALDFRALTSDGEKFVAVGAVGDMGISLDGQAWSIESGASRNNFRGVASGPNGYVASGNQGMIFVSADGAAWSPAASATTNNLHHLTYGNGLWVAVGDQGTIITSPDALQWSLRSSPTNTDLFEVAYGNGAFVAVGGNSFGSGSIRGLSNVILRSTNGLDWTLVSASAAYRLHGITFAQAKFIAVGEPGGIFTSEDGQAWQSRTVDGQYLKSIAYGNGVYIAVGEAGPAEVFISTDLQTWTPQYFSYSLQNPPQLDEITFGDGQFLVVGDNGFIASTVDGSHWQQRHSPTENNLRAITFGPAGFVIVGNNETILQSGFKAPILTAIGKTAGGFELSIEGPPGRFLDLQAATSLVPADWKTIRSFTLSSTPTHIVDDSAASTGQRYYRAVVP